MDEPAMNDLVNRPNKRKFPENEAIIDAHLIYVPQIKRLKRKPDKRKASNDELPAAFKRRRLDAPVRGNDQVSEEPVSEEPASEEPAFDVDGDEAATCDEHEEEPKAPPKKRKRKKDESTTPKGRTRLSLPRKVKLPNLALTESLRSGLVCATARRTRPMIRRKAKLPNPALTESLRSGLRHCRR